MGQSTLPDEAVTPSMEPRLQAPMMGSLPPPQPPPLLLSLPGQAGIFLAGFKDCTEEAVKYLVDVEQIPEQDPLIAGLRQYLWERQFNLDLAKVLSSSEESLPEGAVDRNVVNNNPVDDSKFQGAEVSLSQSSHISENNGNVIVVSHSEEVAPPLGSGVISNNTGRSTSNSPNNSVLGDSPEQPSVSQPAGSQPEGEKDSFSPTELLTLSVLAQNNPAIATLTQELFDLLGEDDEEDDEEEEEGGECEGEGGEEMEEEVEADADESMDAERSLDEEETTTTL